MNIQSTNIVLLQGYPGSGKSTIAEKLSNAIFNGQYSAISHFSIGSHLRKIANGTVDSRFKKDVRLPLN